jgi:sigma-E factor negative regulatory protein RseA
MSEQIREQVSAFLDGELPNSETELLLKRLTRDAELRESFGRYALIGEALRGVSPGVLTRGFASRVNQAIDGEPIPALAQPLSRRQPRWWRPLAGIGVAAGVAAVAIVALQQRAIAPGVGTPGVATPIVAQVSPQVSAAAAVKVAPGMPVSDSLTAQNREALSYTVPTASTEASSAMAPARLTNYVFAHSKYSSGLGQRGVLADLLIEDDAPRVDAPGVVAPGVATPGVAAPSAEVPPLPVKRAAQ